MQTVVSPEQIALAICIPLTKESLFKMRADPCRFDYVASILRRSPGLSREGLWNVYQSTASVANYVADEAERLGVTVFRELRLNEVSSTLTNFHVCTLVAHWCSRLDASPGGQIASTGVLRMPEEFRTDGAALDPLQGQGGARCPSHGDGDLAVELQSPSRRTEVNQSDGTADLCRTSHIELADGIVSAERFVGELPRGYSGVIDLTMCRSTVLGEAIKEMFPDSTVVMNQFLASAKSRLMIFIQVVRELSVEPALYGDALVRVRNAASAMRTPR